MLEILEVGGIATVQDGGRTGWQRYGVPLAGPMDHIAFEAANLLVGNPPGAAALEIGAGDITLRAQYNCLIAVAGCGVELSINLWDFPLWGSFFVRGGWTVRLSKSGFGMWAYVAIAGGFDVLPILGSRSTYLRGRFGGLDGRGLQLGDVLRGQLSHHSWMELAGRVIEPDARPAYGPSPVLDVVSGPQSGRFSEADLAAFTAGTYRISASSDRMGYRLDGPALLSGPPGITSEGMTAGSIQVPPDGQPIAMMADCATTGGYPKIACVTRAALPLLAQCTPGEDEVRFRHVSVEAAQGSYRAMVGKLRTGIVENDDFLY